MLVALTNSQLLPLQSICHTCLLADHQGKPRSQQGRPRCCRQIRQMANHLPERYECRMGFEIVNVR